MLKQLNLQEFHSYYRKWIYEKTSEIHHDHLIKDFVGIEEIISKYLNHTY